MGAVENKQVDHSISFYSLKVLTFLRIFQEGKIPQAS